jgi:hypothetical protein
VIGADVPCHETVGQQEMKVTTGTPGATVRLNYLKIRDVTTKDEEVNGAATYVVVLPAPEILKIGTDGNLRSYIPAHAGKKRNLVHKAIAKTIRENPDRFSQLNSGFLVGASKITVDDAKRVVRLKSRRLTMAPSRRVKSTCICKNAKEAARPPPNLLSVVSCRSSQNPPPAQTLR